MVLKKYSLACITSLIIGMMTLMNMSCSQKKDQSQVVLAKVGKKIITAQDFRYNYEFGLPHLKRGPDSKRSYLDYMIKEELLAVEGYRLGLNRSERVQKLENELMEELLIETLFEKEVDDKITVTPEDIKDAMQKSTVKWKLRYWVEPTIDDAGQTGEAMRELGYGAVVEQKLKNNPEVQLKPEDFNTDYLTWLDVSPELLDAIKDLPIGEISDPVLLNGVYFIFQIIDIRQEPMSQYEFSVKADNYKKILKSRKAEEELKRFVSNIMTPKNVVTKGDAFRKLSDAMYEWYKSGDRTESDFRQAVRSTEDEKSVLHKLKKDLNQPLVVFRKGQWTIDDFLNRFDTNAIKFKEYFSVSDFRKLLNQEIALEIRNHYLVAEALKNKLHKTSSVQKELQIWRDKWLYQEMRKVYLQNLTISDEQAEIYFSKYRDRYKHHADEQPAYSRYAEDSKRDAYLQSARVILNHKIDSLKTVYPVFIDQSVMDTISVIEFQKSKGISMQAFKMGGRRLARPIVDPEWNF